MAKESNKGGSDFRKRIRLNGDAPTASESGAAGPRTARQAYKAGGKVKASTQKRW